MKIRARNKPLAISLLYLILGLAWILFSDYLLYFFSDEPRNFSDFLPQIIKGSIYVILTALLLYILTRNLYFDVSQGKRDLQLIFRNPSLGLFRLNDDLEFTFVSANAAKLLGHQQSDLLGMNILDISPQEFRERDKLRFQTLLMAHEKTFTYDISMLNKEGKVIFLLFNASVIYRNNEPEIIVAFQDITEKRKHLHLLKEQNDQLSEIAYMQSHVFRAPVARIKGLLELLNSEQPGLKTEKPKIMAGLATSAQELDDLIHEISEKSQAYNDGAESEHPKN